MRKEFHRPMGNIPPPLGAHSPVGPKKGGDAEYYAAEAAADQLKKRYF
jgi:hypothetical protein